jgi:hypothetical protein
LFNGNNKRQYIAKSKLKSEQIREEDVGGRELSMCTNVDKYMHTQVGHEELFVHMPALVDAANLTTICDV